MQFNKTPLVVGQESYATKIVKVNIVYDLDNWLKIPLKNFTLKSCSLGATNSKNYGSYGITFDEKGEWNSEDWFWWC